MRRAAILLVLCGALAACGNQVIVTASDMAGRYVYAIAEGNYPGACALLTAGTRRALLAGRPTRGGCPALLRDCLPARFRRSSGDQSQLLYANESETHHGSTATVLLSATPAAQATRRVTLVHIHGRWRLTSPGVAISRCVASARRRRRAHPPRRHHG